MIACLIVGGCRRDAPAPAAAPAPVEAAVARARDWVREARELPPRTEVVALADELAVAASRALVGDTGRGAELDELAARLRTRAYRLDRVEADAAEAIERWRSVERATAGEASCAASVARVRLAAEVSRDATHAWRDAYLAEKRCADTAAKTELDRVMRELDPWRPASTVVRLLDAEAAPPAPLAPPDPADDVDVAPDASAATSAVRVVGIEPYGSADRARIVVTLSGATTFEVGREGANPLDAKGRAAKGARLIVTLDRTSLAQARVLPVGGLVERVRAEARGRSTRIVIELASTAWRRVFYLPEPFRVVVDVASHPPAQLTVPAGHARPLRRVALDPGHGGNDPGAIGPTGLREKDVTLDIAHRAAPVLAHELGILTLLTRDDDRYVALDERTARANAFHADLFVSIHCNASENAAARGVMTFVLDTSRDEIASRVAARENAASLAAGAQVTSLLPRLRLGEVGALSSHLAELLQRTSTASLAGRYADTPDQGVKTAGFFVLVGAEMPSVLYETSFISHPGEEARLATAEYRQKLADAVVNAIRAYREGR